ncbi:predicted protein [Ostreococcus lucimarinus CCE9901]|uniref:Uncharacterized protein n=1 Tax=Ostreococcus lucimarinus (strain CCE9901) TaxID=436017 RepID=A4S0S8_OSTLU|nr:predicted protein [Ostreococcus lucimarinus CCE9901]ABO97323.1 predicted protein [Ostreococcus lucimarinus CCE9901]|eukprot:XP_001419030.1 predicted protein [Ostreococcus lucimarinus CCE9901]
MKDGDDATRKSRHLRDKRDAKLYGKMRELMTSDRGAPGAKAKVRNALKRVDSEFNQRGPDIALDRRDAEVMGLCRDVVSKEAWKRWSANACQDAVKNDSIERLKFLHECECPWGKCRFEATSLKILYVCAEHGSTECMKYLLKHGCKFSNHACTTAAEFGFLECLKYLREHGHHWDRWTCTGAARNGHLEMLKYAHENGCPWDENTCSSAAKRGHLECLKYAHEQGCPWNTLTCYNAASNGHLECLKYACTHGCPDSAPYAKALKEVVLPDADERFVVEVALVFHRSGEISMREFLPLWAEHRMFYRKAHYEAVRKFHASLRLNR